jgi:[acyl-carrier-protein] S-malonyltransferase
MSLALLFPGQGIQHPAMLPWIDGGSQAANLLSLLERELGSDWRARLDDPAWATQNTVAQYLLTGLCLAAWQQLASRLPVPVAIAGYSVGELAAFCAAGVFEAGEAMRLARCRAIEMDLSVAGLDTGLLSVIGLRPHDTSEICTRYGLAVAIRINDESVVLGGPCAALTAAEQAAVRSGAHCSRLQVRLASHTPWMASAAQAFARTIEPMLFKAPRAHLVANLTGGSVREVCQLKQALSGQIASTVQWDRCMETLAERRVRCVLEVGPGQSLSRMWNARYPDVPARSVDDFQSGDAVVAWVSRMLD